MRASWMAQELLTTFDNQLHEVALCPSEPGSFEILLNGQLLFSRQAQQRFPEPREIKQAIRDVIDPTRDLGHSERPVPSTP
ncbi:MAG: SelT/SelW/SelH family protein [Myxococcales bacterium]|nr:SelT/SelW/SelH family protein [Myxococcales bacterium]MCB9642753.1 SelT/SelW/SelH family protein [Myxococcales bacterium]